jgi:hypothetical protein
LYINIHSFNGIGGVAPPEVLSEVLELMKKTSPIGNVVNYMTQTGKQATESDSSELEQETRAPTHQERETGAGYYPVLETYLSDKDELKDFRYKIEGHVGIDKTYGYKQHYKIYRDNDLVWQFGYAFKIIEEKNRNKQELDLNNVDLDTVYDVIGFHRILQNKFDIDVNRIKEVYSR